MEKNFFREKIEKIKEDYDPNKNCSVIYSIQIIGAKWKVPILWNLMLEDEIHYNQLKRKVNGITNTMLTKCLKELEKDGIIRRVSYGSIPPSVTYHLTDIGKELIYAFEELKKWGLLHMESKIK